MQMKTDPVGAEKIAAFEMADAVMQFAHLPGQHDMLQQNAQMKEHENDRAEQEEGAQPDFDLQQRQRNRRIEQKVAMFETGKRNEEISLDCKKEYPARPRGCAGRIDIGRERPERRLDFIQRVVCKRHQFPPICPI
jgi:hypothetical protein